MMGLWSDALIAISSKKLGYGKVWEHLPCNRPPTTLTKKCKVDVTFNLQII